MNRNIKLYPFYMCLLWDVLFAFTIITMFLTNEKGLDYAEVVRLESLRMLFGCLLCIPVAKLLLKLDSVTASRIGNLGYAAFLLLTIFGTKYITFVIAQVFIAFAYVTNFIKVNLILTESLSNVKKDKLYQKIYGKGVAIYYVLESVGAILITYVYKYNPYACLWISFAIVVFAEFYSLLLKNPEKFQNRNVRINSTKKSQSPDSYLKIMSSWFLIFLLLFIFLLRGVLSVTASSFRMYLQQLTDDKVISVTAFGYIFALIKVSAAISSKYQFKFDLRFSVKSLIIFMCIGILSFIVNGLAFLYVQNKIVALIIITISTCLQNSILTPSRIFANNYMQQYLPKKNLEKAYSLRLMAEYLGFALLSATYSGLLMAFNNNYGITSLVYIAIFGAPLFISMALFIRVLIKQYAKKHVIIKDEYTKD